MCHNSRTHNSEPLAETINLVYIKGVTQEKVFKARYSESPLRKLLSTNLSMSSFQLEPVIEVQDNATRNFTVVAQQC